MFINRWMAHYLCGSRVVFLLDELGAPLDSDVTFLEPVRDQISTWFDDTARASFTPVTLATAETLSINCLQNEWFDWLFTSVS